MRVKETTPLRMSVYVDELRELKGYFYIFFAGVWVRVIKNDLLDKLQSEYGRKQMFDVTDTGNEIFLHGLTQ